MIQKNGNASWRKCAIERKNRGVSLIKTQISSLYGISRNQRMVVGGLYDLDVLERRAYLICILTAMHRLQEPTPFFPDENTIRFADTLYQQTRVKRQIFHWSDHWMCWKLAAIIYTWLQDRCYSTIETDLEHPIISFKR